MPSVYQVIQVEIAMHVVNVCTFFRFENYSQCPVLDSLESITVSYAEAIKNYIPIVEHRGDYSSISAVYLSTIGRILLTSSIY